MKQSAGILVFRHAQAGVEVLLTHPGGPIWGKRDTWSIPKGELDDGEEHLQAAKREFFEELGVQPPDGEFIDLGSIKQDSRKINYIFAIEGDVDLTNFSSNTFTMEWPPKSGKMQAFPENDKAAWWPIGLAKDKVFAAQSAFFDRLAEKLGTNLDESRGQVQQTLL